MDFLHIPSPFSSKLMLSLRSGTAQTSTGGQITASNIRVHRNYVHLTAARSRFRTYSGFQTSYVSLFSWKYSFFARVKNGIFMVHLWCDSWDLIGIFFLLLKWMFAVLNFQHSVLQKCHLPLIFFFLISFQLHLIFKMLTIWCF